MDIVEFLTARLDEDQAAAEAASHHVLREKWHAVEWYDGEFVANGRRTAHVDIHGLAGTPITFRGALRREDGEHIARHDPARVLREVEAKREVLTSYEVAKAKIEDRGEMLDGVKPTDLIASAELGVLKAIVRDLAAVYADHPDYEQAWAPE